MKIAVFGTGAVGQIISEKLATLGNDIMIGTRSVEVSISKSTSDNFGRPGFGQWKNQNPGIKLGTYAEAANFGELIVNATNGNGALPALDQAGKNNLSGKVMLDISNPLDSSKGMPPSLFVCNTDSLGEQIQRAYPELKVVKGLNTMAAYVMVNPSLVPGDHNVFLSGNDSSSKSTIKKLLQSFGWKESNIIDLGDITTARGTEQLVAMWVRLWGALQNPLFNFHIVVGQPPKM